MHDFFVSYNKADRAWAEWIAWHLEDAGYGVVIQAWDFHPGSNFALDMQRAAETSQRTIAVFSQNYVDALFTQPEWAAAFVQDPTGQKGLLLPVRVRECELKGVLRAIVYIDLVGQEDAQAKERLLAGVKRERAKPATAPPLPGAGRSTVEPPRFPGGLPPVWNVPLRRKPNFLGREPQLTDLNAAFGPETVVQAVTGLDGIGKTQLAAEYAYRYAGEYDIVWWVRAGEPTTLAADYANLAGKLDLPERDAKDQATIVEAVRGRLEQASRWLLVFDNARDASEVFDYIPRSRTGHVLVTSRDPNWREEARPVALGALTPDEAAMFLCRRTGRSEQTGARRLAEELGGLPLALEQAGSYMEATAKSFADYLTLLQSRLPEMLKRGGSSEDHAATVAKTWELSYREVRDASPAAAGLLHLCAFMAPESIPPDVIRLGKDRFPPELAAAVEDELALDDAVAVLRRYSLLALDGGHWSIHRLVQAVVREWLTADERKDWAGAAVYLLDAAFPAGDLDLPQWPACARLLPHVLAASGHAEAVELNSWTLAHVLNQAGTYLRGRARLVEAKALHERALRVAEATPGADPASVGTLASNLGELLGELNDLAGARQHLERALAIKEEALGPNDASVAITLNNLGSVLQDQGDLAGARALYERALKIDESASGPNHPNIAVRLNNLGDLLRVQYDLTAALACHDRALKIDEAWYGPAHPTVALDLHNRGNVLRLQRDLAGARSCYERALAIDEAAYGPSHLAVAKDCDSLGGVFYDLRDLEQARACGIRALAVYRETLGDNHPTTLRMIRSLSLVGGVGEAV